MFLLASSTSLSADASSLRAIETGLLLAQPVAGRAQRRPGSVIIEVDEHGVEIQPILDGRAARLGRQCSPDQSLYMVCRFSWQQLPHGAPDRRLPRRKSRFHQLPELISMLPRKQGRLP